MPKNLEAGLEDEITYSVTVAETVPELFPHSAELGEMADVLASGYLVAFIERACVEFLEPFLDWPEEQSVGIQMDFTHEAPTPPDTDVTIRLKVTEVNGRELVFDIECEDEVESIGKATHKRFIVDRDEFLAGIDKKRT